jgi:hypothetical protein
MAIISRAHRLLFIMAAKTGCTAVGQVLIDHLSGEFLPRQSLLDPRGFFLVQNKHCTLKQLLTHRLLTSDERRTLFAFSTVRNPFDALVSFHRLKANEFQQLLADPESWVHRYSGYAQDIEYCKTHDFNEWIKARYAVGVLDRLRHRGRRRLYGPWANGVDFVMRFEHLQTDFDEALRRAGVKLELQIPVINVTDRAKDYRQYYSRASRRIVEYAFQEELARFRYRF